MSGPARLTFGGELGISQAPISPISPAISPVLDDSERSKPNSPQIQIRTPTTRLRSGSSVSRVGVNFFDPAGVEELRRVLTERSNHELRGVLAKSSIPDVPGETRDPSFAASSTITLAGLKVEDGLDFEKTVRHIVRK